MPSGAQLLRRRLALPSNRAAVCQRPNVSRSSLADVGLYRPFASRTGPYNPPTTRNAYLPRIITRLSSSQHQPKEPKPTKVNASVSLSKIDECTGLTGQYRSPQNYISPGDNDLHESPYTIPNALTIARIIACPFLGYHIIHGNFGLATGILFAGGVSDAVSTSA